MQAETVHQNGQHNRRHRTARRGDVGVGNVFVPRDDVVQVDHVALGHGQQTAEQIDLRRPPPAPHVHPPQRAEDRKAQGCEQQDWKKGVQHQSHLWRAASCKLQAARKSSMDRLCFYLQLAACGLQLSRQKSLQSRSAS